VTAPGALARPAAPRRARRAGDTSWWHEAAGSVADLGVLVPIAVALVVTNGLSTTAVLLPAGLAYLVVARVYRLPVAVQPLKAFGAAAIAAGAGPDVIAAGALLMGATFLALGATGLLDRVARLFPVAVIRGVQLAVGLTFLKIAWGLAASPQPVFTHQAPQPWVLVGAVVLAGALLVWRRWLVLAAVLGGLAVAAAVSVTGGAWAWGPSALSLPHLDGAALATAAVLLVLPQLPLTFANSCLAPADAARRYFPGRADAVTPGRLARTLGAANLLAGTVSGMPVCHGAGGMSAHHAFGARTGRAPALVGTALVVLALGAGAGLATVLPAFPLPVLAALLVVAAVAHVLLLRDLRGAVPWAIAVGVGVVGVTVHLGAAVLGGLLVHAVAGHLRSRGRTHAGAPGPRTEGAGVRTRPSGDGDPTA
jgi:sulfate permease, SulP family